MSDFSEQRAVIELSSDGATLLCRGTWTATCLYDLEVALQAVIPRLPHEMVMDMSSVDGLDSAGALILEEFVAEIKTLNKKIKIIGLSERYRSLVALVLHEAKKLQNKSLPVEPKSPNPFAVLGRWCINKILSNMDFLSFIGQFVMTTFSILRYPSRFQFPLMWKSVDVNGTKAMPIVALLTFLVGVVITYQISLELDQYGMNLYIVDIMGLVILREFGPLITAIIAAARTGTAITAQIGTMKVNEELDAMRTMGISLLERLVVPKFFGLIIAMVLLTVWADFFGVLGGMIVAKGELGIGFHTFISRFQQVTGLRQYFLGLLKAPIFAMVIAAVGCFQGFQVAPTADSVGSKTTQSAVQSVFLVIVVDAFFSILFSWQGI